MVRSATQHIGSVFRFHCDGLVRFPASLHWGIGQPSSTPVQSPPNVRRADAMCAQYRSPAGVAVTFHACLYSIEPPVPNR